MLQVGYDFTMWNRALTRSPATTEVILGRALLVETSTEIIAKKIWHRGPEFTARDIFDFAAVAELEPAALQGIGPILRDRRATILDRVAKQGEFLRKAFELLEARDYQRSYDECVRILLSTCQPAAVSGLKFKGSDSLSSGACGSSPGFSSCHPGGRNRANNGRPRIGNA
jgi:hypothetical protein